MTDLPAIDLSTVHGCQEELQTCARGLAYLDHLFTRVLDRLTEVEAEWDVVESDAIAAVSGDLRSGATATELKAAINRYVDADETRREWRDAVQKNRKRKAELDRWFKSLEKRLSAAQSALNGHEALGRYGGGE